MRWETPESKVTENPDGSRGTLREGGSASVPADVNAMTFQNLEPGCPAVRVAWSFAPDRGTE